ncbi:hypothetical protein, partial [Rhodoplanes roseus]|uniref:hypothetical protein n=1 Tax=Rhodoplanes roseus TaxID=29409 RepID=UPI001AECB2AD
VRRDGMMGGFGTGAGLDAGRIGQASEGGGWAHGEEYKQPKRTKQEQLTIRTGTLMGRGNHSD